ncbi:MAG: DegT/DnrJ/EryC1/StrS aminotransferase family protein [Bacteroidota bacterium]|nr:DegT/DnrJ/EryC1/StrS aminotransferase family protein [Bacteroidota bacterium]
MIPFSPPRMDQKIIDEVNDTLRSGWITTGPKTKRFEKELARFAGVSRVLCTNANTTGLELMLRWFGVGPGDEVIVPAYTYCATANVIVHCGAKAVMVDCNENDFNINPEKIRDAITENTKVIMPVDLGGYPADYDEIYSVIDKKKALFTPQNDIQKSLGRILVLADAAHSLGGIYKEKPVGSLADISVFSFHAVKNLTTSEGGAIALNLPGNFDTEAIYQHLNVMSLHGQSKDALAKSKIGNWRYDVIFPGYKANMTDIQASMGIVEIARYKDDTLMRRRKIVETYNKAFENMDWAILPPIFSKDKTSSFHLYQLRIKNINEATRNAIIEEIFKSEVSVNVHYQPIPMLTYYKNAGYNMHDYPVAFKHYEHEISLPVYYDLSDENEQTVIESVKLAVNKTVK